MTAVKMVVTWVELKAATTGYVWVGELDEMMVVDWVENSVDELAE